MTDQSAETSRKELIEKESKEDFVTRCLQKRFVLGLLGFWCFFVLSALRMNVSIAIVAMVNWRKVRKAQNIPMNISGVCHYHKAGERPRKQDGPFLWDPTLQGHILGCYFYGLASTQLIGGRMAETGSAKWVLFFGTLVASISTLVVPVAAKNDGYAIIALQLVKGFGQGIMMPAFSVLMAKWVPATERARFMSFIVSGMPVGSFITVLLSGYICKVPHLGWKYAFYIFGAVGSAWCIIWVIFVHDSPLKHPRITSRELMGIVSLRSQREAPVKFSVPFKAILSSSAVWAYFAVGFASSWALSLYVSVVPLFMGTILRFGIEKNGVMSSLPNLVQAVVMICTSLISDFMQKNKILSTTMIRKTFITVGLLAYALCITLVTFAGCNRNFSVLLLVSALGMSGFNFASVAVVSVDMSPRFAGTISGIMNTFGALSGVIIPAAIGYLTEHKQTINEWSYLFYVTAAICVVAAIIFVIFGSSEKQPWNEPTIYPIKSSSETAVTDEDDSTKEWKVPKPPDATPRKEDEEDDSTKEWKVPKPPDATPRKKDEEDDSTTEWEVPKPPDATPGKKDTEPEPEPKKDTSQQSEEVSSRRPWRTGSFQDIPSPTEPTVIITDY